MTRLSKTQARKLDILPTRDKKPKPVRVYPVQWDAKIIPGGIWIQVPQIPPSLNVWMRWHWSKQQRYKQELTDAIRGLVMAMRLPRYRLATVQIIYYFSTVRRRDADNMTPKFVLDALVRGGVLEDDRADWIKLPEPRMEVDKDKPRMEIFIWGDDDALST